jgi:predicted MFS family arabinose efflux permease
VVAISFRNMMQPLFQPLIMDALPHDLHNLTSGIGMVLWNIGWFAATAISGRWQTEHGFDFIMRVVAAGALLNGALIVWVFRRGTASGPRESAP